MPDVNGARFTREASLPSPLSRPWPQALLAGLLAMVLYLHNLQSPFIFDDWAYIAENPLIRDFGFFRNLGNLQQHLAGQGISLPYADLVNSFVRRPVTYLTFAVNYRLHGLDAVGYNLLNIFIHAAATMLVYLFVHLLVRQLYLQADNEENPPMIPFLVALLFASHPIQTQAVSYVNQRFASLAALFYLLTLSAYLLCRRTESRKGSWSWYALALAAAVAGMLSKENVFTLPVVIVTVEFLCFRESHRQRLFLLFPFLATMAIIPLNIIATSGLADGRLHDSLESVNFDGIPHLTYLFTQFRVLVTYLRLLVLPVNQQLDYDYPIHGSLLEPAVFFSLIGLLALVSAGTYLLFRGVKARRPLAVLSGFGIVWFFLTLSVESGLVPMDDVIFEHRLYLPSTGIFLAVSAAGAGFFHAGGNTRRRPVIGVILILVLISLLSAATVRRNALWADAERFVADNAAKSPNDARVRILLGDTYLREGKAREAIAVYEKIRLTHATPQHVYTNLANAYLRTGEMQKGMDMYRRAMENDPGDPIPYSMLGIINLTQGNHDTALELLNSAILRNRLDLVTRKARAELFRRQERITEAISEYESIVGISPNDSDALDMLNKLRR